MKRYSKKDLIEVLLAWKQTHKEAPSRRQLDEDKNLPRKEKTILTINKENIFHDLCLMGVSS